MGRQRSSEAQNYLLVTMVDKFKNQKALLPQPVPAWLHGQDLRFSTRDRPRVADLASEESDSIVWLDPVVSRRRLCCGLPLCPTVMGDPRLHIGRYPCRDGRVPTASACESVGPGAGSHRRVRVVSDPPGWRGGRGRYRAVRDRGATRPGDTCPLSSDTPSGPRPRS